MKIEKFVFAALIDIAIAVEHLCLAATEQGLATCWVYNFDANLCKELFSLPENDYINE